MTFEELLTSHDQAVIQAGLVGSSTGSRRAWLDEPGFHCLYVRIGRLLIPTLGPTRTVGKMFDKVIQLASLEVEDKGKGVFTSFVKRIESYGLPIFIENVLNERFVKYLPKLGFIALKYGDDRDRTPCFFKTVIAAFTPDIS